MWHFQPLGSACLFTFQFFPDIGLHWYAYPIFVNKVLPAHFCNPFSQKGQMHIAQHSICLFRIGVGCQIWRIQTCIFGKYHENSTLNTMMYIRKYIAAILLLSHCDCLLQMCFFGLQKEKKNIVKKIPST